MARNLTSTLDKLAAAGKLDSLDAVKPTTGGGPLSIDIGLIIPDPEQPRRSFDTDKLKSLSDSISVQGVLQPITIQPENKDGKHLIIMGERRWRAAQMAGLSEIPAIVREADAQLRAIQITENVQRADLTTMEIALAVEQMRKDGMKRPEIAKVLGWGQVQVSQFAGVLSMPDELQELAQNNVPVRALADLHSLWKKNDIATREFAVGTSPEDISRVSVANLRASIEAGQGDRVNEAAPDAKQANDKSPEGNKGIRSPSAGQVAILCKQGDEIGRILTDRKAQSNKALMVSFANGERIEEVALTDIVLLEVIEL